MENVGKWMQNVRKIFFLWKRRKMIGKRGKMDGPRGGTERPKETTKQRSETNNDEPLGKFTNNTTKTHVLR